MPTGEREPFEKVKKRQKIAAIVENWQAYRQNKPGSQDRLLQIIIAFVQSKLRPAFFAYAEIDVEADDVAQQVVLKAWHHIESFRGEGRNLYAWLNRVSFTERADAYAILQAKRASWAALEVESQKEPGIFIGNPLFHEEAARRRNLRNRPHRKLPDSIQGKDLLICEYVRGGLTYQQIAEVLVMTKSAVSRRVERMKARTAISRNSVGVL